MFSWRNKTIFIWGCFINVCILKAISEGKQASSSHENKAWFYILIGSFFDACTGWSKYAHFAHVLRRFSSWNGPYIIIQTSAWSWCTGRCEILLFTCAVCLTYCMYHTVPDKAMIWGNNLGSLLFLFVCFFAFLCFFCIKIYIAGTHGNLYCWFSLAIPCQGKSSGLS